MNALDKMNVDEIKNLENLQKYFSLEQNTKDIIRENVFILQEEIEGNKELIEKFENFIKTQSRAVQKLVALEQGYIGENLPNIKPANCETLALKIKEYIREFEKNKECPEKCLARNSKYEIIEELLEIVGLEGKKMPKNYALEALVALTFYPELLTKKIYFLVAKTFLYPYESRPYVSSLIKKSLDEVRYKVMISKARETKLGGFVSDIELFENLTPIEKIGALTHELGHTQKYTQMIKKKEFLNELLNNFSEDGRKKLENEVDEIALENGAGMYLIPYRSKTYPDKVKKGEGNIYYSAEELMQLSKGTNKVL